MITSTAESRAITNDIIDRRISARSCIVRRFSEIFGTKLINLFVVFGREKMETKDRSGAGQPTSFGCVIQITELCAQVKKSHSICGVLCGSYSACEGRIEDLAKCIHNVENTCQVR